MYYCFFVVPKQISAAMMSTRLMSDGFIMTKICPTWLASRARFWVRALIVIFKLTPAIYVIKSNRASLHVCFYMHHLFLSEIYISDTVRKFVR